MCNKDKKYFIGFKTETDEDKAKKVMLDYLEANPDFGYTYDRLGLPDDFELDYEEYGHQLDEDDMKIVNPDDLTEEQFSVPTDKNVEGAVPTETQLPKGLPSRQKVNLYKYASPSYGPSNIGSNTRDFCKRVVKITNKKLLTFKQIQQLNDKNPGFGKGGSNTYNVLKFRGGSNCRHLFYKFILDINTGKFVKAPKQPNQPSLR